MRVCSTLPYKSMKPAEMLDVGEGNQEWMLAKANDEYWLWPGDQLQKKNFLYFVPLTLHL